MKKKLVTTAAAFFISIAGMGNSLAQDGPVYIPVDIFGCTYKDGKGPADLDAVIGKWNAYMDGNDADDYAAWTMTKHYAGPEQEFDVAWLGAHKSGTSMGEGADKWLAEGGEVAMEFGATLDCPITGNFASRMFKAPPSGNVPESGVIVFSDCSAKDGVDYEDVVAATEAWVKLMGDAGSRMAFYHWYPVYGGGGEDFDWKQIESYPSHTELGKDYDRMGNGGMFWKQQELLGDLVECDVSRAYNVKLRRAAKIRD